MSNFRFGADDYKLSYYPPEASNGIGGVDWDKVESVEIEFDEFVKVVRCRDCKHYKDRNGAILPGTVCQRLGYYNFKVEPDGFCKWAIRRDV